MSRVDHRSKIVAAGLIAWSSACLAPEEAFGQPWPNEPAGSELITDFGFDKLNDPEKGWYNYEGGRIVMDAGAKQSAPETLEYVLPAGQGWGGGVMEFGFPRTLGDVYIGFWYKASVPTDDLPAGYNKLIFLYDNLGGGMYLTFHGPPSARKAAVLTRTCACNSHLFLNGNYGDPCTDNETPAPGEGCINDPARRKTSINLFQNVASPPMADGEWNRLEVRFKWSSSATSRDGWIQWWVNGQPAGDYRNVNFGKAGSGYNPIIVTPVWSAPTDPSDPFYWDHPNTTYLSFDHIRITAPTGGGSGDATPPAAPRGLSSQ